MSTCTVMSSVKLLQNLVVGHIARSRTELGISLDHLLNRIKKVLLRSGLK